MTEQSGTGNANANDVLNDSILRSRDVIRIALSTSLVGLIALLLFTFVHRLTTPASGEEVTALARDVAAAPWHDCGESGSMSGDSGHNHPPYVMQQVRAMRRTLTDNDVRSIRATVADCRETAAVRNAQRKAVEAAARDNPATDG